MGMSPIGDYGIVSLEMVAFEHTEDSSLAGQLSFLTNTAVSQIIFLSWKLGEDSSEFDQIIRVE